VKFLVGTKDPQTVQKMVNIVLVSLTREQKKLVRDVIMKE
jgi:hypothetical protein